MHDLVVFGNCFFISFAVDLGAEVSVIFHFDCSNLKILGRHVYTISVLGETSSTKLGSSLERLRREQHRFMQPTTRRFQSQLPLRFQTTSQDTGSKAATEDDDRGEEYTQNPYFSIPPTDVDPPKKVTEKHTGKDIKKKITFPSH